MSTVGSDEIILRRIPPDTDVVSTQGNPDGTLRATSSRLKLRPGEQGLSCTRLCLTSPLQLLQQLTFDGIEPEGWMVCRLFVSEVNELGLQVLALPTDRDPGHCEIRPTAAQPYTGGMASKLAKKTRILTQQEVEGSKSGDRIP